ncbi:TPA: hypothetical protein ACKRET_002627 [Proteus mirabilis]
MSTIPTQNPVPSEAAKDLKFNSGKIDEFVTSMKNKYIDRFGQEHFTIEGLRWVAQQAISQFGYITLDSFQKGAEITLPNQVLRDETTGEYYRWDGELPKIVPIDSTPDNSGGVGVGKWLGVGDASLRGDLSAASGTDLIGYGDKNLTDGMKELVFVNADKFPSIQDAVNYAASLSGNAHSPSSASGHPTWIQPNTTCRVVKLNGKKYPIKTTLNITGDVSIDAGFGGVYLTDDFIPDNSGYAVVCSKGNGNQYAGNISDFLIDARAKTVNGFKIKDGYANQIHGLYVSNIDGNGIHIEGGMGIHLCNFQAISSLNPSNPLSSAHIIEGSDHHISNGEGRYFRFGTWIRNGGNNRIDKVHNWGMYDNRVKDQNSRMKCCFVVQNSINNSFNQCFADSPSKWDYLLDNNDPIEGYVNGGYGFLIDSGSEGNSFIGCQAFINMKAFNEASLSDYKKSLVPFGVGSINCDFVSCKSSLSDIWKMECVSHIYHIDDSKTFMMGNKGWNNKDNDEHVNPVRFNRNVTLPLVIRSAIFENTSSIVYEPDFSESGYISVTVNSGITISPKEMPLTPDGLAICILSIYSAKEINILFSENITLAKNFPSFTFKGTMFIELMTSNKGKTWLVNHKASFG